MWYRASALRRSNSVRRRTTSRRKSMKRLDQLEKVHDLRPPADDGEHDDAEAHLQLRVLIEIVEDHLRHFAALQLDHHPHAVAVRLVAQIGDAFDHLVAHQIGDPLDHLDLVHLIRNLGDDDRLAVALLVGLDLRLRAHHDRSAPGRVGLDGADAADDVATGREIGRRDDPDEIAELFGARDRRRGVGEVRVLDQPDAGVDDFAQIVRRHVGRHADGDPR